MQICFRCDETTNTLLEKQAKADGISKNRLINNIVNHYLNQKTEPPSTFHPPEKRNQILPELRLANEKLARILAETNDFYFSSCYKHTTPEFMESFQLFRSDLILHLADLSKKLDVIRKNIET